MNEKPVQVLLIEDNPGDAHLIRAMISEINRASSMAPALAMTWCKTLQSALDTLSQHHADVVLLDLTLPDTTGLVTLARVQTAAPEIPIVVLTGVDDEQLSLNAVHNGAQDYLVKGQVDAQLLKRAIRYAMERMELMATLRKYSRDLEQQNAELDAYARTVAHDLKNPLAAMVGNAELLIEASSTVDRTYRNSIAGDIVHAGHKLHSIIQELLLFSQIRKTDVESTPLDMSSILNEAMAQLVLLSPDFVGVDTAKPLQEWPVAQGYAPWIEEVWVNYLSNALKYGGRPPQIVVGAESSSDGRVRFWVSDNGQGLARAQIEGLFTEFTRLSQAHATGHGLGLSIVKRIVEKLGGEVGVESEPGYGSTFYFTLPAARPW